MDVLSASQPSTAKTTPRGLSKKGKVAIVLFSLLVSCIILEVGLHITAAIERHQERTALQANQTSASEYWAIYDPDLGYRQNPKFGDLNADGLRDHPIGPKANRFRVLFLGDSIAFYGDTIDDTFVGHLRATLRKEPAFERLDIIDAGIRGFTNYQEVLYLKKYGLHFQPDLVGIEFCLNDLHKFLHSFRVENGQIMPNSYQFSTEAVNKRWGWLSDLVQRSYLLSWIKSRTHIVSQIIKWKAQNGFEFDYAVDISTAWRDEAWQDIVKQLQEVVQLGQQHHFKVFLTVVPVASQYNAKYLQRDRSYVLKPQRKLHEICENLGIPFYNLYPDLQANMFLQDGIHLTQEGRQVVGERLAAFLSQSHILPTAGTARLTTP
jgi:lysophospholipase L1-like esterase